MMEILGPEPASNCFGRLCDSLAFLMNRKRIYSLIIGYIVALVLIVFAQQRQGAVLVPSGFGAVVDLTHPLNAQVPGFEASAKPQFSAKTVATIEKDKYFARIFSVPEHFGTHIDAPAHFIRGLWTVDKIPPERLVGPLVIVDVSANVKGNPDYQVSVADIGRWEKVYGQIGPGSIVMVRTGWGARW